jgi:hypothetical protein
MNAKVRNIDGDARAEGQGPWSPHILEEDARRLVEFTQTRVGVPWNEVKARMDIWGTASGLPPPTARKL